MYRHRNVLDINLRKTLCNSLIQCLFDYSCSSWYNGVSARLKQRLQTCQNKVVRFILDYHPRTSLTDQDFTAVGILRVEDRVKQLSLNHVHKIFHNKCPSYLQDNFQKVSSIHDYGTRSRSNNFYVQKVSNKMESETFYHNSTKTWNALPSRIKEETSHNTFKTEVKRYLLDSYSK